MEILYTLLLVFCKVCIGIGHWFRHIVCKVYAIDQYTNPLGRLQHVPAEVPECLLLTVADLDLPAQAVEEERGVLHLAPVHLLQRCMRIPCTGEGEPCGRG